MVIESIRNNISALQVISQLYQSEDRLKTNLQRISSGLRINSARDDAGDLLISSQLETQFRGLSRASQNMQNTINLTNTGLSATDQIINLLNDIRDAAVAASGGSAAQQSVIQEKIEELNRIVDTTKFGNKYLLNGSLTTTVGFKSGTRNFGATLAFGPNATTLFAGRSYLNIAQTNAGSAEIKVGGTAGFQTGISISTDIAVSTGRFVNGGAAAVSGDNLIGTSVNQGVSLSNGGTITFTGVLADGNTFFSGTYSITAASTIGGLINSIQSAVNNAESYIGINGTGVLETTVGIDGNGRLRFTSGSAKNISEFNIDISIKNAAGSTQTSFGIDYVANIYNQDEGTFGTATNAKIGNNVTAITGSTFDSGTFDITVSNIVSAQQREIVSDSEFDQNALGDPVTSATALVGSILNGTTIAAGDTFLISGTDPDGSTFSVEYTVGVNNRVGDAIIEDYGDLIDELNNRDRSLVGFGFNGATATLTANGEIQLVDDIADTSSTNFSITYTDVSLSATQNISATATQAGSRETATFSINGGAAQEVYAGQVVTLKGLNASGGPLPEVTFRAGSGFTAGTDQLETSAKEFVGTLNSGTAVTFQNGDIGVRFTAGEASVYPIQKYQQVTLDFDSILDVTTPLTAGGETFVISTTTNALNFQIGSDRGNIKSFLFADLRSDNLGTSASANLDSIDVTTATGATDAIDIVDDALDQVNSFRARLGAFSSRLDDTVSALDAGALNLETAYTSIISADIARETTELTMNSVLMQAQAAVLAQANNSALSVFEILYGLD
ncbi:MAG: hypothetical protein C4527_04450 [Candidatus Omnitrophota bacterium]|jgi:flagellin|nr:MAG: hypothetical protein C4527_04450 [Candidatus Omnitrophota bacterium]